MQHEDHSIRPTPIPWPPILLVAAFASAILLRRYQPLSWPGLDDWPARAIGISIGIAGVVVFTWAVVTLMRSRTTVMPHKGVSSLVVSGPYRWFRNPIYLGDVMIMLGLAEMTKNLWFVVVAAIFAPLVTLLQILPEERHLEAKFGDAYRAYKERTRRWI